MCNSANAKERLVLKIKMCFTCKYHNNLGGLSWMPRPRKGKKLICKPCGVLIGIPGNECQSGRRGGCHGSEGGSGS
ncbi:Uncharacterized protein TCM_008890 [Theobroma cacao]|uniref:Uncharacterized protein n=1 Tax=Theobroma cacao TaxID=3641 RepID=A0A061E4E3_THECC|nr:Uncharacterized protein TCM_008890 [Theobroma cacao]